MIQQRFTITNCGYNRANYPQLIGQQFDVPPGYAGVNEYGRPEILEPLDEPCELPPGEGSWVESSVPSSDETPF